MAEASNPELIHKYVAIDPNGVAHGYDNKMFFDNLKRMHQVQKVSGWQYGESKDYETLLRSTPKGQNIKNAELIADVYDLKDENAKLKEELEKLKKKSK